MTQRGWRHWLTLASFALNLLLLGLLARPYLQRTLQSETSRTRVDGSPWFAATEPTRLFAAQRAQPESTVFLGDSITAHAPWGELFAAVLNRGIPGNTTQDVLNRLDEIVARQPRCVVLLIGINDLLQGRSPDAVATSVATIVAHISAGAPNTQLTLISTLPLREASFPEVKNKSIRELNHRLAALARPPKIRFVDVFDAFVDGDGQLQSELTYDGIHLLPSGYWLLRDRAMELAPNGKGCPAVDAPG